MQKLNRLWALPVVFFTCPCTADTQVIQVHALSRMPVVDSQGQDWTGIPAQEVPLQSIQQASSVEAQSVLIKAGFYGDMVYFFLQWPDNEASDTLHKPYVWNENSQRYLRGPQREDRFALQFEIKGDYSADWREARNFKADMWHWKATRSNPLGLAHDKYTIHSPNKLLRSSIVKDSQGRTQYIMRISDTGTKLYTTKRYRKQVETIMPKYILNPEVSGSVTDIKARGSWGEGRWQLELARKMDTGHPDDVTFVPGTQVKGGIAVFDASESYDHNISQTLIFQF